MASQDVKYQVFISSTYDDLREERRTVMEQIITLGHIPVGMEMFNASDDTQWNYIKDRILECDYYIVIIAMRYGSTDDDGISFTHKEYEFAVSNGIPVAAFFLSDKSRLDWPHSKVDAKNSHKLDEFRDLCLRRLAKPWDSSLDLALKVSNTLSEMFRRHPRVGWVRGTNVLDPHVVAELASLSEEKRRLQNEVLSLKHSGRPPQLQKLIETLRDTRIEDVLNLVRTEQKYRTIADFIEICGERFVTPTDFYDFNEVIEEFLDLLNNSYEFQLDGVYRFLSKHELVMTIGSGIKTQVCLTGLGKSVLVALEEDTRSERFTT